MASQRVAIAGAHGQIGLRLARLLVARGVAVTGLVRNPDHAGELSEAGVRAVVCDLETAPIRDVTEAVADADAVVFAAGAGPGSGAQRKLTMDRDGAIKLLHASDERHAQYLMVSSVGAEAPPDDDDVFSVYLRAKADADAAVMATDRQWTIVRPGPLTNDPGLGRVRISTEPFRAAVARDDVAALLAALVPSGADAAAAAAGARRVLYLGGGELPIPEALITVAATHSALMDPED